MAQVQRASSRRRFLQASLAAGGALAASGPLGAASTGAPGRRIGPLDLEVDVTGVAELGEQVHTAATVVLPDPDKLTSPPIVCVGLPGGGYSRHYYTFDMPGSQDGGEAGWHAARGWIFVAIDHLGVGESSLPDRNRLLYRNVSAANDGTVREVLRRLRDGSVASGFPAIEDPLVLGIGQSMGGCLTVVQQARHNTYDGIGVLGYSAIHTFVPQPPGEPRRANPYFPRDHLPGAPDSVVNSALLAHQRRQLAGADTIRGNPLAWVFHYDDVPEEVVRQDLGGGDLPVWRSATRPGLASWVLTPGAIAPEAAAIVVPTLLAFGERDVLEDPWMEPKAYKAAVDISLFVCPRMGHMHNFASTREVLWKRIERWGQHVSDLKQLLPQDWPSRLISNSY